MKLHRDINVTQKIAWSMLQRLRAAFQRNPGMFDGIVEADETHMGGKDRNRHESKRGGQRGSKGKTPVIGIKNRKTRKVRAIAFGFFRVWRPLRGSMRS